ncbi:MAG TPA: aminoglycoside phosphotransferase family protein [Candidatus Saccharimonadales bacterium]
MLLFLTMHELDNPELLNKVLDSLRSQLNVQDVKEVGRGNEFYIFGTELPSGSVVIKVPKDRIFSNVNDAYIDSRLLLDQEFALMRHAKAHGIFQVPEPIKDIEAAGFGAVIMSYVPSDNSKPDEFELGTLLARIHSIETPNIKLSAQEGMEIPELIAERLTGRWKELGSLEDSFPELPPKDILIDCLESARNTKQLLHMDFRRANFRMQKGKVAALLDWSNALIGHPALELARVAETGETGEKFLDGYASVRPLPGVSPIIETIFRLDTATMLALVFLSEDPDPERAPIFVRRVRKLHSKLLKEIERGHEARTAIKVESVTLRHS